MEYNLLLGALGLLIGVSALLSLPSTIRTHLTSLSIKI